MGNILSLQEAKDKEESFYAKSNNKSINGEAAVLAKSLFEVIKRYDETKAHLINEDECSYEHYRKIITILEPEFISFSRQIIRAWDQKLIHHNRGIYGRGEQVMRAFVTESHRLEGVTSSLTNSYCHQWINWILSEINKMEKVIEKRKALNISNASIRYLCVMIVNELTNTHQNSVLYDSMDSLIVKNEIGDSKVYMYSGADKQFLMSLPYIHSRMVINAINSKLLYVLRDKIFPNQRFILDGHDIDPIFQEDLKKDTIKK